QPGSTTTLTAANSVTDNGTLQLNNVSQTINGLSGSGVVQNIIGGNTLTVGAGNATSAFSGVIQNGSGTMNLTKNGTGELTLSGANTFTGLTRINGGVIKIAGAADRLLTTSTMFIDDLGAFDLNGFNQTLGTVTNANGDILLNGGAIL